MKIEMILGWWYLFNLNVSLIIPGHLFLVFSATITINLMIDIVGRYGRICTKVYNCDAFFCRILFGTILQ